MAEHIKQIIVVEGRDDTKRLREAFGDVDTIETHGSAINDATLARIKHAQETRGVIVLTDPDFQGQRIRKIIMAAVPDAQHAFLPRNQAVPERSGGSLGVEHAHADDLQAVLGHLFTMSTAAPEVITREDLWTAGLLNGPDAKRHRELLGDELNIGYANGKQLVRRLRAFAISTEEFAAALRRVNERINND